MHPVKSPRPWTKGEPAKVMASPVRLRKGKGTGYVLRWGSKQNMQHRTSLYAHQTGPSGGFWGP